MLKTVVDDRLPPLGWIAILRQGERRVEVRRGSRVEVAEDWLCEAAWAGEFASGQFDRTPLVFGSGVRWRGGEVRFVSAGTTVDRLWTWRPKDGGRRFVSNSLVQILASAEIRPVAAYRQYKQDLESIVYGLEAYRQTIPVTEGRLDVVYFDNLSWDGHELSRVEKPRIGRDLSTFSDYRTFLSETADALAQNASSSSREHPINLLTSVSSGYDSPAVSVIAREMGCRDAVTISQARTLIPRSDSGREIGEALGLDVTVYDRDLDIGPEELRFWAALGKPQDVNLGIFEYPEPVCLFMTGFHGDKVWTTEEHDTSESIVRGDSTGLGFTEDRLHRGVLHCPLPYWGGREMAAIDRISRSGEMEPWRLCNDYDRPIPRRIVESEGIEREAFGQKKSATSSDRRLFPYTPELRRDFGDYARDLSGRKMPVALQYLGTRMARYLASVRDTWPWIGTHLPSLAPDVPSVQFQWAADRLLGNG